MTRGTGLFLISASTLIILSIMCAAPAFCNVKTGNGQDEKPLSLTDSILIALKNNVTLDLAYRDRVVQRYDLRVAEDKFTPKVTISSAAQKRSSRTDGTKIVDNNAIISAAVTETLPTGGQLDIIASRSFDKLQEGTNSRTDDWSITLSQPLLKGGGLDTGTASVRIARLSEQINVLSLKSLVIDMVTSVITYYRNFLQATKQLEISRQSVERAKELVRINRELIAAGRMAEVEIVQTEADVATQEFNLLSAENSVDSARLELIKILDMNKKTMIVPTEKITIGPLQHDPEQCMDLALRNRTDYLIALLGLEISRINLKLAENNKLWDLSLFGGYGGGRMSGGSLSSDGSSVNSSNWNAGIRLNIPLRDLTLQQGYLSAKIGLEKAEINLRKMRENIEIEVQDALRDVEMKMKQVRLAQQARVLSEKKLEIENEKMKAGRSTNFQLVSYQNDLVNVQYGELNAIILYLNALTSLDRTLGYTLEQWHIVVEERYRPD